jgi:hypothetical protein
MAYRFFGGANSALEPHGIGDGNRTSVYLLVISCAIPVVMVAMLMICLAARQEATQQPLANPPPLTSSSSAIGDQSELHKTATLQYWQNLSSSLPRFSAGMDDATVVQALRTAANNIENLSSLNVDQEALDLGAIYCKDFRDIADHAEYLSSPDFLANCFVQGAQNGDVLWGARTRQDGEAGVKQDAYEIRERRTAVRQILSQRYGIELDP